MSSWGFANRFECDATNDHVNSVLSLTACHLLLVTLHLFCPQSAAMMASGISRDKNKLIAVGRTGNGCSLICRFSSSMYPLSVQAVHQLPVEAQLNLVLDDDLCRRGRREHGQVVSQLPVTKRGGLSRERPASQKSLPHLVGPLTIAQVNPPCEESLQNQFC